ncbi:bifunctional helix-turn-helix transcriptional regulator/GNAT family N-acetyltransferase [Sphingomonas sp.]|uniref:bifunctional helix-turn-helix transcriptional regulator/GNAT family N-acetyltransferase n=1 Tax=Sphingomonas sp. TaxID=28214 RepID=UPI003B3A4169
MATDVLAEMGPVFLGSRLKRLAERLQASAGRIIADAGLPVQPTHMPLLAALDRGPMTVGELADTVGSSQPGVTRGIAQLVALGLVSSARGADLRRRTVSLTPAGQDVMATAKRLIWPRVGQAVDAMLAGLSGALLDQIAGVEAALADRPLEARVAGFDPAGLRIVDFRDDLAPHFHDINADWIGDMFRLEQTDRDVLEQPRARIVDPGGAILFVEAPGLGVIGTCALQKTGPAQFELTKMGVRASARGMKAGEFLLAAMIARAQAMGAETLYLLTNRKCAPAIHLYEKLGFRHDAEIMATYGARYERCDVAMRYVG